MNQNHLRLVLACILLAYAVLAVLFAVNTPDWQAPDEPAHYNYVRYLAGTGRFPELQMGDYPQAYLDELKARGFPPDMSIELVRYEFHQPPLYYALAAPLFSLTGGDLLSLRLFSVVLGAGLVLATYAIARRVLPGEPGVALGAAALVAFLPQHLATAAQVGNDMLAELLLALVLLQLVTWAVDPAGRAAGAIQPAAALRLGVLLGLVAITKTTVYVAFPLAAGTLILLWWRSRAGPRRIAADLAWIVLPAAVIALPWYARNVAVYGWPDFLGLIRHDRIVIGQLRTSDFVAREGWGAYWQRALTWTFKSFWGVFGWMGVWLDSRAYDVLGILSAAAAGGLLVQAAGSRVRARGGAGHQPAAPGLPARVLLAASVVLALLAYAWYNTQFLQHQGRYLFTALIPLAVMFSAGWMAALRSPACNILAGLLIVAGLALGAWSMLNAGGLPEWRLAIIAACAAALVAAGLLRRVRKVAAVRFAAAGLAALPFAGLPLLSLYALFGAIVPQLAR